MRLNDSTNRTLVAPGEIARTRVYDATNYSERYDMICFVTGEEVLPSKIFGPEERKEWKSQGITGDMLNSFIEDYLGRAIAGIDRFPLYLLCDKSRIHNIENMTESFQMGFCFEIVNISFLPTQSAKRLSPLDNSLFNEWKSHCRQHYLTPANIRQVMNDEWSRICGESLKANYQRSLGRARQSPYFDCPLPTLHKH